MEGGNMSVTLEDAARAPWVEVGVAENHTPADEREIEEVRQIFRELARELAEHPHGHYAGGRVSSSVRMRGYKPRLHRPWTGCRG